MRLTGAGVTPETVSVTQLTNLLEGVVSLLKAAGGDPSDLHLVDIKDESAGYVVRTGQSNAHALIGVIGQFKGRPPDEYPEPLRASLVQIQAAIPEIAQLELTQRIGDETDTAVLTHTGPPVVARSLVRGITTYYGTVMGVVAGERATTARVRVPGRNKLLYAHVSREQAQELGKYILQAVRLDGLATWSSLDWELDRFQVHRITPFSGLSLAEGLRALAEISGDAWKDVDALDYVNEMRRD